jgi:putative nucleotidyltransferase with HDIG domain
MDIQAAAGIVYAHPPALQDDAVVLAGNIDLNLDQIRMLITHIGSLLSGQNEPVLVNDFVAAPDSGVGSAVKTFIAAPLMTEGHLIGLLMAINKKDGDFDSGDSKLLHSISDQASVFLVNHRLYADLQDLLMGVLHALTATIDAKDPYTRGHSQRVALLSRKLAKGYGMGPAKVQQIYLAGLLHDIGKIGVPEAVLCKEGRLTAEEYETIKRHPAIGAKILQGIRQLEEVVGGILTHHERPDGRGYPHGLHGADVPIEGRIVGLADVFDAMTSDRTYRKALKLEDTVAEIQRCAGAQFDQSLVNLLMSFDFPLLMEELRQCNSPAGGLFGIGRQEVVA